MAEREYTDIAINDIGTQLFIFNKETNKFEYCVPVTAPATFGGDTESTDAPETDLPYTPKIAGRTSLNDIEYTSNYTRDKYQRINTFCDNKTHTYMEVMNDGSAMVFQGASGMPERGNETPIQINFTIIASFMQWIYDIKKLSDHEKAVLEALKLDGIVTEDGAIAIDETSIPTQRQLYYASSGSAEEEAGTASPYSTEAYTNVATKSKQNAE